MRSLVVLLLTLQTVLVCSLSDDYFRKWMGWQWNDRLSKTNKILKVLKDISKKIDSIESDQGDKNGYIGCFLDDSSRQLPYNYKNLGEGINLAKCRENCKGYKYVGLQYRVQCFCGNRLEKTRYKQKPESDCNMRCPGELSRICGSAGRNSVYLGMNQI
ncbi:unnamed protein product [Mytilus edulis]|uniref:WSC domain-containing protein n=1 Tax=Mytilus edulis TaxID=6550 RepID=A0A8S3UT66_MYTED|nr:unnamed protein product [Mytilus edulis]